MSRGSAHVGVQPLGCLSRGESLCLFILDSMLYRSWASEGTRLATNGFAEP